MVDQALVDTEFLMLCDIKELNRYVALALLTKISKLAQKDKDALLDEKADSSHDPELNSKAQWRATKAVLAFGGRGQSQFARGVRVPSPS